MIKTNHEASLKPEEIAEIIHLLNLENAQIQIAKNAFEKELATLRPLVERLRAENNTMKSQIDGLRGKIDRLISKANRKQEPQEGFGGYPPGAIR